jgi:hypothetical protein
MLSEGVRPVRFVEITKCGNQKKNKTEGYVAYIKECPWFVIGTDHVDR